MRASKARKTSVYKGYELYVSDAGNGQLWTAKSLGEMPEFPDDRGSEEELRKLIDAKHAYPWTVVRYRGIDIWFDPNRDVYYASLCEHTKRSNDIRVIKRWINEYKQ
ncbi:MAG: hypothetical protein NWE89_14925 [Candidatus Bathyarchaeota archaeon]|nr:hypothetical protein [Candidatus Bathyarchaeota archaeon]